MRTGTTRHIAEEQGVSRQRVHQWIGSYPDFPKPVPTVKAGIHYDLDAVARWAAGKKVGASRPES